MTDGSRSRDATTRLYEALVDDDEVRGTGEVDAEVAEAVPGNAVRIIGALTLQKIGDRIADPKTVLAWLLSSLSAPAWLAGLLVPVRESGSLLLQSVLVGWVKQRRLRKHVWMVGGVGQALSVAAMAAVAATLDGVVAGVALLLAVATFALSRSLSSLAYKDVLGRTIPKGQRGQVSGFASMTSGLVAIGGGLGMRALGPDAGAGVLAVALVVASGLWAAAVLVFSRVEEPEGEVEEGGATDGLADTWRLLRGDAPFRRFVITRSLLLVSALSPPFVVVLARADDAAVAGLGGFVVAQGLASLVGGRLWGGATDRSSRRTMMGAAAAAAVVTVAYVVVESTVDVILVHLAAYFLLALAHEGARLGRKTYVTDMAEGNTRTAYVAAANSAMGVVLLAAGGLTAGLGAVDPRVALVALALGGAAAVPMGRTLPEV